MINLIENPQRADVKAIYEINGDMLTVTIDDNIEIFDFTGLSEGVAEEIIVEVLPINPIVKVEKVLDVVIIEVIRFYNIDDKELFENG